MIGHTKLPPVAAALALFTAAALAPIGLAGCAAKSAAPPSRHAEARTWAGQVRYAKGDRATMGSFAARSGGRSDFDLDFYAGPGVTLLRVEVRGARFRTSGPLARGTPKNRWRILADRFAVLDPRAASLDVPLGSGESFQFRFHSPR